MKISSGSGSPRCRSRLITRQPDATDDARRRYYRLTGLGQRVCSAEADRLAYLVRITRTNLRPGLA